mgnify:CR=1 FL=1
MEERRNVLVLEHKYEAKFTYQLIVKDAIIEPERKKVKLPGYGSASERTKRIDTAFGSWTLTYMIYKNTGPMEQIIGKVKIQGPHTWMVPIH